MKMLDGLGPTGRLIGLIIFVGIVLLLFGFRPDCVLNIGPFVFLCPQDTLPTSEPINTKVASDTPEPPLANINTPIILVCDNFRVEGNGNVEACTNYIKIKAEEEITVYQKDNTFQNLHVDLYVNIINLDNRGIYSVVLRQANDCRLYEFRFKKTNTFNLKVELYKHLCDQPSDLLNQSGNVTILPNQPHKLSVSVEGAQEVNFSVKINEIEIFKAKDNRGFIWSGNFGVSVENGEVEFTEIKLSEQ